MSEKFTTIWGDLQVTNTTPAPEEKDKDKGTVDKDKDVDKDKPEDSKIDDKDKPADDDDKAEPGDDTDDDKDEDAEDVDDKDKEKEKIEFTEEDVNKAFTMLDDENVLELSEEDDFDATPQGLADAIAATVRNKLQAEIAATPPVVQQFYSHVINGNDPADFKPEVETDWSEVLQTDEENQKEAYFQFLKNQKLSDELAQEEVEDAVERGILAKKAEVAFTSLIATQETVKQQRTEQAKKAEKEAEAQRKKEIDEINKTIDNMDEYAGFKLDDKRKSSFKDYLFKPNPRTGKTQMQENMSNEERRLRLAFLDFVDFNKDDIKKEVQSEVTKQRKKKLSRFTDKSSANTNSSRSVKQKVDSNKGKIKFPSIFGSQVIEVED